MTTTLHTSSPAAVVPAPLSGAVRVAAGISLILAGLLNGGAQYVGHLVSGDETDWIRWAAVNQTWATTEQIAVLASMFFLPLGLLGIAQVTRWRSPRLTAVATVLVLVGMWGFHTVAGLWYAAGTVAPQALGVEAAVRLNDAYSVDPGVMATALAPHLLGSFVGLVLLCVAAWRSFPAPALLLVLAFLAWDWVGAPVGPLEAHLLLTIGFAWLGVHLIRMSPEAWRGEGPA